MSKSVHNYFLSTILDYNRIDMVVLTRVQKNKNV